MRKQAVNTYVDYQERGAGLSIGDVVTPYFDGAGSAYSGRIVQIFPAIGMADVEFPHGSKRFPVEELQVISRAGDDNASLMPQSASVPGGAGVYPVSAGPRRSMVARRVASIHRVALYWLQRDRQYRPSREESTTNKYKCPRCKCEETGDSHFLRKKPYKRMEGLSEHLFVCPHCTFMIKEMDISHG